MHSGRPSRRKALAVSARCIGVVDLEDLAIGVFVLPTSSPIKRLSSQGQIIAMRSAPKGRSQRARLRPFDAQRSRRPNLTAKSLVRGSRLPHTSRKVGNACGGNARRVLGGTFACSTPPFGITGRVR